eukprot:m.503553 g.503553  ORF g.503553 m.503553 type:complete len:302 (-) comp21850_c1_seq1:995-1900(-)
MSMNAKHTLNGSQTPSVGSRTCTPQRVALLSMSAAIFCFLWQTHRYSTTSDLQVVESAAKPTPRTLWSSRQNPAAFHAWHTYQQELARLTRHEDKQVDVVFLGDSIFESFLGTSVGNECSRCIGVPQSFQKHFGGLKTMVRAISGDQTQHLLWRIIPGGGRELENVRPKVIVLCIGTNNIGAGMTANEAAHGVFAVVTKLQEQFPSNTRIIVSTLLPRTLHFQGKVAAVNEQIRSVPKAMHDDRLILSECAALLAKNRADNEAQWQPDVQLMPDGLHPGRMGMDVWLPCLKSDVLKVIAAV